MSSTKKSFLKSKINLIVLILTLNSFLTINNANAFGSSSTATCDLSLLSPGFGSSLDLTSLRNGSQRVSVLMTPQDYSASGLTFVNCVLSVNYRFITARDSSPMTPNQIDISQYSANWQSGTNTIRACVDGSFSRCSTIFLSAWESSSNLIIPNIPNPTFINPNNSTTNSNGYICLKITSQSKECFNNIDMSWTYNLCWSTTASKINLDKWNKKKKKFEKIKTFKIKKSSDCEKDYPKLVKFTFTETDMKSKTYRISFIGDSGGEEEKIKVTFE